MNKDLGTLIGEGTLQAAALVLREKGVGNAELNAQGRMDALVAALRAEAKAELDGVLDAMKGFDPEAITPLAERMFRDLLNLACNRAARRAVATALA